MGIAVNSARSDSYIGTFYKKDKSDMEQLVTVRKIVSNLNKDLKRAGKNYQFYVKCQGHGHIPLNLADSMDAYIYKR